MKPLTVRIGLSAFGAALAVLGLWGCHRSRDIVGKKGSPTDSPVVVRGGSVSAVAYPRWFQDPQAYTYFADVNGTPDTVYLDWVGVSGSPKIPTSVTLQSSTNWKITLTLRDADAAHSKPATQIQICSAENCVIGGSFSSNSVFLVGNQIDTTIPDSYDNAYGHLHFLLPQCGYAASDPDPKCNHIADVIVAGFSTNNGTYHCVDGTCDVWIAH